MLIFLKKWSPISGPILTWRLPFKVIVKRQSRFQIHSWAGFIQNWELTFCIFLKVCKASRHNYSISLHYHRSSVLDRIGSLLVFSFGSQIGFTWGLSNYIFNKSGHVPGRSRRWAWYCNIDIFYFWFPDCGPDLFGKMSQKCPWNVWGASRKLLQSIQGSSWYFWCAQRGFVKLLEVFGSRVGQLGRQITPQLLEA